MPLSTRRSASKSPAPKGGKSPAASPVRKRGVKGQAHTPRWTPAEEEDLRKIVESASGKTKNWDQTAEQLGTGRTPSSVQQHWAKMTKGEAPSKPKASPAKTSPAKTSPAKASPAATKAAPATVAAAAPSTAGFKLMMIGGAAILCGLLAGYVLKFEMK